MRTLLSSSSRSSSRSLSSLSLALLSFAALAGTTGLAAADADSDAPPPRPKTLGIDGGLAVPTGTWGDAVGFGLGALGRFEMPITPAMTFTARTGLIYHLGKDQTGPGGATASTQSTEIPLFGGLRYAFSQTANHEVYGAAELGLVITSASVEFRGMSNSASDTNLGMTLGGGFRTGKLDLRGGLLLPDLGHAGDALGFMATVGFDLTAL